MRTKLLVFAVLTLAVIFACTLPSARTGEVGVPTFQATIAPTHMPFSNVYIEKPAITPWGTVEIREYWWDTVGIEIEITVVDPSKNQTEIDYELKCDGVTSNGSVAVGLNMLECNATENVELKLQDILISNSYFKDHDYSIGPKITTVFLGN